MATTLTISISPQDLATLKENPEISATKLFRSAMILERHKEEFLDVHDIVDYRLLLLEREEKIYALQKEIVRRNERIDSLQDVLAQKELNERRLREAEQKNNGLAAGNIAA